MSKRDKIIKNAVLAVALAGILLMVTVHIFMPTYNGYMLWSIITLDFEYEPLKPEITYGEFPFRLTYELNGEIKIVEDTLICEFDGFVADYSDGKHRNWKSYLKSGNTRITLFKNKEIEIFYTPGLNDSEIAATYMGDTELYNSDINSTFPDAYYTKNFENKSESKYIISGLDMWHKYGLRLIKWEPSSPIQNTFK